MIENNKLKQSLNNLHKDTVAQLKIVQQDSTKFKDDNPEIGKILQLIKDYQNLTDTLQQRIRLYEQLISNYEHLINNLKNKQIFRVSYAII